MDASSCASGSKLYTFTALYSFSLSPLEAPLSHHEYLPSIPQQLQVVVENGGYIGEVQAEECGCDVIYGIPLQGGLVCAHFAKCIGVCLRVYFDFSCRIVSVPSLATGSFHNNAMLCLK